MDNESIFVQIASYRDPELVPTILDMFETADDPDNLHVCICWQHDDSESLDMIRSYRNIEIIDVPYYDSKGACWARNQIQRRYNGERYTFQLDSHHRFVNGWDSELKIMYQQCQRMGSKKPLITSYIPAFDPFQPKETYETIPWKMNFHKFLSEGPIFFSPSPIQDYETYTSPIPARFYSAHFAFTDGKFCEEVSHDPEYYFYGEEISITVRAFTHGYDLYHPHKVLCWHEYTRSARFKHWDDHDMSKHEIRNIRQSWWARDQHSQKRNRVLFGMEQDDGVVIQPRYNFGKERSLEDYERYAGINFKNKEVSVYTLSGNLAPTPYNQNYVSGTDPENLHLLLFSKKVTFGLDFIRSYMNLSRIKIEIYDHNNRVITVQTFNNEIVNIWKMYNNDISFNIDFNALEQTGEFYYIVHLYDDVGRLLNSVKKSL